MDEEIKNDENNELYDVLCTVEEKYKKVANIGRQLTQKSQEAVDIAKATRNVIKIVNTPPNYEDLLDCATFFL